MRVPEWFLNYLVRKGMKDPYVHLPGYMNRYWIKRPNHYLGGVSNENTTGIGIRLHEILASDTDRHLHDHPWWNISIILRGSYIEEIPANQDQNPVYDARYYSLPAFTKFVRRKEGDIIFRRAKDRHRLHVCEGSVLSLFIFGPWEQVWGFHTERGKVNWREYLEIPEEGVEIP